MRILPNRQTSVQPVYVEQQKGVLPANLFVGLGVVLALPALAILYYAFVAVSYAIQGNAAFCSHYGIQVTILAVAVGVCVFVYRYRMKAAGEIRQGESQYAKKREKGCNFLKTTDSQIPQMVRNTLPLICYSLVRLHRRIQIRE